MALTDIDRRLLRRCLANEPGSWKDFVDRYLGLFVHVIQHTAHARSVKLVSSDLDDLCSEICLTLLENDFAVLKNFRGEASLATYLTVVARRVVVREIARRSVADSFGHSNAHSESLEQAQANGFAEQSRIDDREQVKALLAELPAPDANIVRLYHLESKSYREISDELGVSENSIGPALSRVRERLRKRHTGP